MSLLEREEKRRERERTGEIIEKEKLPSD